MNYEFNLEPQTQSVTIGGRSYEMREMDSTLSARYKNAMIACGELGTDGKPRRFQGLADLEPLLVSLCLFDDQGQPVALETILKWPGRVVQALHGIAKTLNPDDVELPENPTTISTETGSV